MTIIFDLDYLNENLPDELPKEIIVESNVIPRKGDMIDFDENEPLEVEEVRLRYHKTTDDFQFQDVYVFLKTI